MIQNEIDEYDRKLATLKYADQIAKGVLDQQLSSVDTLITSASILIGLSGILAGILLAWIRPKEIGPFTYFLLLSLVGIIISLLLALLAAKPTSFEYTFNPEKLKYYTNENELTIMKQVYSNMANAYEINDGLLKIRWSFLRLSMVEIILAISSMIICVIFQIAGG